MGGRGGSGGGGFGGGGSRGGGQQAEEQEPRRRRGGRLRVGLGGPRRSSAGPGRSQAGPGGGAPRQRPKPPSFEANEAEYDPFLKRQAGRLEDRMADTEGPVGRELDLATGRRRAQTGAQMQSGRLDLAKRGMLGTSSGEETMTTDIMGAEAADLADLQAGTSYDREAANDRFLLGATSGLGMPGDAARGDRAVNRRAYADQLAEWESDQYFELEKKSQGLNEKLAKLNLLSGSGGIQPVTARRA